MSVNAFVTSSHFILASSVEVAVNVSEQNESILHLQGSAHSEVHALQGLECPDDVRSQETVEVADCVRSDVVEE